MLIYNQHSDSASMDECQYMIDKVSFMSLRLYVDHMSLLATVCVFSAITFTKVLSAFFCHLES
jgi:hypothetical protein